MQTTPTPADTIGPAGSGAVPTMPESDSVDPADPTDPTAGRPSAAAAADPPARAQPLAERVTTLTMDAPWGWLAAGWRDLMAAWPVSLALGGLFTLLGLALTVGLVLAGMDYLVTSVGAGFLLVAPALAMGFYDISRRLERGERPSLGSALTAWRANPFHMLSLGVALMFLMMIWLRFAALIFALFFPYVSMSWGSMLNQTLSPEGLVFLAVGSAVGAVFAAVAFVCAVISAPMMLDRKVDAVEAVLTSIVAVLRNGPAMALWAGLIAVFTQAGLVTLFVGLALTLPLIGHASWHAYRETVRTPEG
ncbi:DUF2189 domain-containing protein [Roseospira goensis]|uniref:Putative membrane protein n=1 Tax=Roseospira goensis TaxID=391922 RepID=A0A7W6RWN2_9PROT|nr:DUF2189 domain-containing protein [Roseospira goensis]MBB4284441.1 putative membrane protein [Roseospira goensis]